MAVEGRELQNSEHASATARTQIRMTMGTRVNDITSADVLKSKFRDLDIVD